MNGVDVFRRRHCRISVESRVYWKRKKNTPSPRSTPQRTISHANTKLWSFCSLCMYLLVICYLFLSGTKHKCWKIVSSLFVFYTVKYKIVNLFSRPSQTCALHTNDATAISFFSFFAPLWQLSHLSQVDVHILNNKMWKNSFFSFQKYIFKSFLSGLNRVLFSVRVFTFNFFFLLPPSPPPSLLLLPSERLSTFQQHNFVVVAFTCAMRLLHLCTQSVTFEARARPHHSKIKRNCWWVLGICKRFVYARKFIRSEIHRGNVKCVYNDNEADGESNSCFRLTVHYARHSHSPH